MNNKQTLAISYCIIVLISLLFVTGCGTSVPRPDAASADQNTQAELLVQQKKYVQAAELYLQIAQKADPKEQAEYRLHAAEILIMAAAFEHAQTTLALIDSSTLNPQQLTRYQLTRIESYTRSAQFEQARDIMQELNLAQLDDTQAQQYIVLSADIYAATGDYQSAVKAHIQIDNYPYSAIIKDNNQVILWDLLTKLNPHQLTQLRASDDHNTLAWVALVDVQQKIYENKQQLQSAIDQWQISHPLHSINQQLITEVISRYSSYFVIPEKIAVLLPMTGRYSKIAQVIYAGITAAQQLNEHIAYTPEIVLYDTGDNASEIMQHYQAAVDDGAEYIIGPLNKLAVELIAQQAELSVPILTLNYLPKDIKPPQNLYQFGLLPEDEASQVADQMFTKGYQNVLILTPQEDWEMRLVTAFSQRFDEFGGNTLDIKFYEKNKVDFSDPLKQILLIDQSELRRKELNATLGQRVEYQPRRRQDAEAIFLVARPELARLIRPQINYHYATELPVYSTSHIFSGTENITKDRDINEVIFCDMPWILAPQAENDIVRELIEIEAGDSYQELPRFAALGIDAYYLPLEINALLITPAKSYPGVTGHLSVTDNNHIYRQLIWSKFRNGRPRLISSP